MRSGLGVHKSGCESAMLISVYFYSFTENNKAKTRTQRQRRDELPIPTIIYLSAAYLPALQLIQR